jgi:hypothetical protein
VCGGGAHGHYGVYLPDAGAWTARPTCKRCWHRLFTHTELRLWGLGRDVVRRGWGAPSTKDDPEIKAWAKGVARDAGR